MTTKVTHWKKKFCHKDRHSPGCRPSRPLCATMRKVRENRRACGCDVYHFPHRKGSGRCGNPYHPFIDGETWMEAKRLAKTKGLRAEDVVLQLCEVAAE